MNILFLDQFTTIGGGQRSLLEILPALTHGGFTARVGLPGDGPLAQAVRRLGVEVDMVPCGVYTPARKRLRDFVLYARDFPRMAAAISNLVAKHQMDLIYVNGPRFLPPAAAVAGRARLLFHAHHRILQPVVIRLVGEALRRRHACLIACCAYAAGPLRKFLPNSSCHIIYNGVPAPSRTGERPVLSSIRRIGVIGRIEPEKGQREFVAAARLLHGEFPDLRFLIAGSPLFSGPEYLQIVKEMAEGLPFEFVGWQADIGGLLCNLDLLVAPSSDADSTPRVILEAFAAGVPVVAFPAGGIPEIVEDNRTGFLAAGRTPEALALRIRHVLTADATQIRGVTSAAKSAWQNRFTVTRFQWEVREVLRGVCSFISSRKTNADKVARTADTVSAEG